MHHDARARQRTLSPPRRGSGGVTVLELVVALALVLLSAGAVLPAVVGYLSRGTPHRLAADLEAVDQAARRFRLDLRRWPGSLADLVSAPSAGATDLAGRPYPASLAAAWSGPYLTPRRLVDGALETADDGRVRAGRRDGVPSLVLTVSGLSAETIAGVDRLVDGVADPAAGRVRTDSAGAAPVLVYHAAPLDRAVSSAPSTPDPPPDEEDPDREAPPEPEEPPKTDWDEWLEWLKKWWEWWKHGH